MKDIAIAETTTVNWENPIYWLLNALKKQNLENFNSNLFIEESRLTIFFTDKIGLKQSDLCSFCGEETENQIHLFLRCK